MNTRTMLLAGSLALAVTSVAAWAPEPPAAPSQDQTQPAAQGGGRGRGGQRQQQTRDRAQLPQGTAAIAGRVLTADTGRPVKRARVAVSGGGRGGGRTAVTDDQGRYVVDGLPAGSYTVTASKTGFVDAVFGQRRPLQPGTPIDVADAQQLANVDLRIVRGGVITGRVLDEDGEPLARALVTVQRYQYVRGERQLMAAGGDQTDDRGQYRVFGLPPANTSSARRRTDSDSSSAADCSSLQQDSAPWGAVAADAAGWRRSAHPTSPKPPAMPPPTIPASSARRRPARST